MTKVQAPAMATLVTRLDQVAIIAPTLCLTTLADHKKQKTKQFAFTKCYGRPSHPLLRFAPEVICFMRLGFTSSNQKELKYLQATL